MPKLLTLECDGPDCKCRLSYPEALNFYDHHGSDLIFKRGDIINNELDKLAVAAGWMDCLGWLCPKCVARNRREYLRLITREAIAS